MAPTPYKRRVRAITCPLDPKTNAAAWPEANIIGYVNVVVGNGPGPDNLPNLLAYISIKLKCNIVGAAVMRAGQHTVLNDPFINLVSGEDLFIITGPTPSPSPTPAPKSFLQSIKVPTWLGVLAASMGALALVTGLLASDHITSLRRIDALENRFASQTAMPQPTPITPFTPAPTPAPAPTPPLPIINAHLLEYAPPTADEQPTGVFRYYYIAAEEIMWNFAPPGSIDHQTKKPLSADITNSYSRTVYVGYTDNTFQTRLPMEPALGLVGPIIRAEVGDIIRCTFLNRATMPFSIHPHGVRYDHNNSGSDLTGAGPVNGTMPDGGHVTPGSRYTYSWYAGPDSGPLLPKTDSHFTSTVAWPYHSHVDEPRDIGLGLIGAIIIAGRGVANATGGAYDVHYDDEYILYFMNFEHPNSPGSFYTINGRVHGNLEGIEMERGHNARFHVIALGRSDDIHPVHWHAKTVRHRSANIDTLLIAPGMSETVDFTSYRPGMWMIHCHIDSHFELGMYIFYHVSGDPNNDTKIPIRAILPDAAKGSADAKN